jgi:hypothetical protein
MYHEGYWNNGDGWMEHHEAATMFEDTSGNLPFGKNVRWEESDRDRQGAEPEDIHIINGKKSYIYNGRKTAKVAPEQTANIFSRISKNGESV